MEVCDLLYIRKKASMKIMKSSRTDEKFIEKLEFLQSMPLFKMIEASHLQPLISNLIVKTYSKGEYI